MEQHKLSRRRFRNGLAAGAAGAAALGLAGCNAAPASSAATAQPSAETPA